MDYLPSTTTITIRVRVIEGRCLPYLCLPILRLLRATLHYVNHLRYHSA